MMKMKAPFLYIFILLAGTNCKQVTTSAASLPPPAWLAKNYNHVVMIEEENTAEQAGSYLVDIPLKEQQDSVSVFFLNTRIPLELFKKPNAFYPSLKEFILIVPDWKYYQDVAEASEKKGIILEPLVTNYYYHITRNDQGVVKTDSTHISGNGHPRFSYTEPVVPKDMLNVYRTESYGSVCCPRDPRWDLQQDDVPFIKAYEQVKGIAIQGIYKQNNGKEGEHTVYYTLPGLASKQRLDFILEKRSQWIINKETKDMSFNPQIFTPQLIKIEKEGFRKMTKIN
ncbi:hypothetical protein [Elizabethkingia meningoseptica]|uniref:hypothetical protein n=2 Tax=Elizabethkingia meningoseptica TaxID=238 RepID=UPI0023AF486B|nr:hypothetical protein [Elizabethkingia meningoseptica]